MEKFALLFLACLTITFNCHTSDMTFMIDADFSNFPQSSTSIEKGIKTALSEVSNKVNGRNIIVKLMDHRGNSKRSKRNIIKYLKSNDALVMFSGMHSPPLLKNKEFINKNGVLYLDPWAAAAPITRTTSPKNWIFRLSIDDSKAGQKLVDFVVNTKKLQSPHLVLENTGWGKSNLRNMKLALKAHGIQRTSVSWFDWNINKTSMNEILKAIESSASDSVLFVGSSIEGAKFCEMMSSVNEKYRVPIISHWGITGGNFANEINYETRQKLDLSFLQTRFSFLSPSLSTFQKGVFLRAQKLFPSEFDSYHELLAPVGFIHAYDLTRLLIHSLSQVKLTQDIVTNRNLLRLQLESISQPIQGLIKVYDKPFSSDSTDFDSHEALAIEDYSMAIYGAKNEVVLIE